MAGDTLINILERLIDADQGNLTPKAADAILAIQFSEADQLRVAELGARCNQGSLTPEEASEYENFVAAGELLALWKAKARLSQKQQASAA